MSICSFSSSLKTYLVVERLKLFSFKISKEICLDKPSISSLFKKVVIAISASSPANLLFFPSFIKFYGQHQLFAFCDTEFLVYYRLFPGTKTDHDAVMFPRISTKNFHRRKITKSKIESFVGC